MWVPVKYGLDLLYYCDSKLVGDPPERALYSEGRWDAMRSRSLSWAVTGK